MAVLYKRPDVLSLSGNLQPFEMTSASNVRFKLFKGETLLLNHSYAPGEDGRVLIDVKQIVESNLTFLLKADEPGYLQPNLAANFKAQIDDEEYSFRVIRSGVDNLADTAYNWLKLHFLTWQPVEKKVTYYSPEWLTYYAVDDCSIKIHAYFPDGTDEEKVLLKCTEGNAYTVDVQYGCVARLYNNKLPMYYDVLAYFGIGQITRSEVQRYMADSARSEDEEWISWENSLGGYDTARVYGINTFSGEHTHNISFIDDTASEYAIETKRKYTKNTGHLNKYERQWLLDFFPSRVKYVYTGNTLRRIVVTEDNVTYKSTDLPSSYTFTFQYTDTNPYLNLQKKENLPSGITIPVPSLPDFTLPPRIIEYPRIPLSGGVLFPAQHPNAESLGVTTLGALKSYIIGGLSDDIASLPNFETFKEWANENLLSRKNPDTAEGHIHFQQGFKSEEKSSISMLDVSHGASITGGTVIDTLLIKSTSPRKELSGSLIEEGDGNPEIISLSLIEEGGESPENLSRALTEESSAAGFGGTLGELDNVDPSFDTLPNGKYAFDIRNGVAYPAKVSSSGSGSVMKLTYVSEGVTTVSYGSTVILKYNFSSTLDGEPTGPGTFICSAGGKQVSAGTSEQGENTCDVTTYMVLGGNTILIEVTDSYGVTRKLSYTVEAVNISISSTFDASQAFTSSIVYKYIPVGSVLKTVHFVVDGKEIGTAETAVTNRQQNYTIPKQAHGSHTLEVYITAVISGINMESNRLYYDLVCVAEGNTKPVIASAFRMDKAGQYVTLAIPYQVYDPAKSTADVTLSANGKVVSALKVDRAPQTWNYRVNEQGSLTLTLTCGSTVKRFVVEVAESSINVSAETENQELYLTSMGRSNNEATPGIWSNNGISASFTGFNFVNNGWIANKQGFVSLKVSADARVTIPLKLFGKDFRSTGKTIEFELETTGVSDYEAIVIDCMNAGRGLRVTAQKAMFASEQSSTDTQFKEDERVRIAFVVEDKNGSRLLTTYINGIASRTMQYPADDNFMQAKPVDITIGSNECTVCIYNIRVYDAALNQSQIFGNYIADMDDLERKILLYTRNQIFNDAGEIVYDKVLDQIPGLTVIGDLPQFKGDKKTVMLVYVDKLDATRSWTATNVQIDVQGTSSQYYPRKNYKVKCKDGFVMALSGETVKKLPIREGEIAVNTFCFKADFAESSGTHNTGMAKFIERLWKAMDLLTLPQKTDNRVRTTIDGFPMTIFHRVDIDAPQTFLGKYNFNNDKSTQETFGFVDGCECWEIKNNTSDAVLFLSSDYSRKDNEGNPDWLNDFEARYPDDDNLNAEYAAGKIPTNLKRLTDWLVSVKGNPAKFKAEAEDYLHKDFICSYYLVTELFAMVDQRAKNMFLTTFDGVHWIVIFYDNDTCNGINNEGAVAFGYDVEYHDIIGSGNVFNGEKSSLWNNVEQAFAPEITAMYQQMRSKGMLSFDNVIAVLNGEQSDKWCESIYNEDGYFKYIVPLLEEGNGSYLYALQGSRTEHRKWWLYNRFKYIDSKYVAGDYKNDFVTMRLYTPASWQGVPPNADFTLTPYSDLYASIKFGSYVSGKRGYKGVPVTIQAPAIQFNDTETIVYGASGIKSLGDLSGKYPGTVDISKATKLTELVVGSTIAGYTNGNLTVMSIGNNTLFRLLNVINCPNLTQPIDVSGCENIEEIYAQGTSITSIKLPVAGKLRELHLPGTITNLTVRNQLALMESGLELGGIEKLTTLCVENTNGINTMGLISKCFSLPSPILERVRFIGVDWQMNSLDMLIKLSKLKGMDANGLNADKSVVTGKCHVLLATSVKLAEVRAAFPELTITYTQLKPDTVTTFVFGSSQSKTITNAVFECNFDYVKVSESTYKITAQDNETITFTFKCENHVDYSNSYLVAGTRTQNYSVTYIPLRTIRVKVYNQSIYPAGATVKIGDKTLFTDANGSVAVRGGEAVSGSVSAFGYAGNTFSFSSIISDTTNTVEVYAAVEVKFIIKCYTVLIQGATIQCEGEQGLTNLYGECILLLGKGTHAYTVKHPNYFDKSGNVTVGTSAMYLNITMSLNPETIKPEETGNIQMTLTGVSCSVDITSPKTDYVIDWGDGTTTNSSGASTRNYTHTYSTDDLHNIEILNCTEVTHAIGTSSCLVAYWGIGNSKVRGIAFQNYSKLIYFGKVFKNDISRTSLSSLMSGCSSLNTVDLTPLAGMVKVTSLSSLMYGCSSLTTVDLTPLAGMVEVTDLSSLMYRCSSLTTVDLTPLAGMVKVTSLYSLMSDCSSLTTVDLTPLAGMVEVTRLSSLMYGCSSLNTVDLTPLAGMVKVTSLSSLMYGCSSLTTVDLTPLAGMVEVTDLSSLMYRCSSLTTVDLTPLAGMVKATSLSSLMSGCSSLTTVDLTPLAGMVKATSLSSLISNCSSLTTVDLTPLAGMVEVTSLSSLMSGCSSLATVDLTPLAGMVKVTSLSFLMYGCSSLNTVDLTPLAGMVEVTDLSYFLSGCSRLLFTIVLIDAPLLISSTSFNNTGNGPIYVPNNKVDAYKTATNWNALAARIKPISDKPAV